MVADLVSLMKVKSIAECSKGMLFLKLHKWFRSIEQDSRQSSK